MAAINAIDFYKVWCEVAELNKEELLAKWQIPEEYTSLIFKDDNPITGQKASKLGLWCRKSSSDLDAVFYKNEDIVGGWLRHIRIAFEHENFFRTGLNQETARLLTTNCDLRVLVSYPNSDEDRNSRLKYLHSIISPVALSKSLSDSQSFLVIFGYENGFVWEGFIYNSDNWKILPVSIPAVTSL